MKKLLFACCLALLVASVPAQTPRPAPSKELLIVDFFLRNHAAPAPYAELLRGVVLDGFAARGRHRVLDAATLPEMAGRLPGTGTVTPESAPGDLGAFLGMRAPQAADAGARYLVSGAIVDYKFSHAELPAADSKKPPRQGFRSTFRVVISAIDLKTGTRLPDQAYELTATERIADDADRAALYRLRGQLEYYIDRNFRFETQILECCPPDRKGRVRELYIHSGTSMGVKTGDLFLVYEEVPVGGIATRRKIGRLRVVESANPEAARCKIAKGDAEIEAALLAGHGLICVSDGKAFGY